METKILDNDSYLLHYEAVGEKMFFKGNGLRVRLI